LGATKNLKIKFRGMTLKLNGGYGSKQDLNLLTKDFSKFCNIFLIKIKFQIN
jgi:hypothetical protein